MTRLGVGTAGWRTAECGNLDLIAVTGQGGGGLATGLRRSLVEAPHTLRLPERHQSQPLVGFMSADRLEEFFRAQQKHGAFFSTGTVEDRARL